MGPGSQITVPDVTSLSIEAATDALTEEGFVVSETRETTTDPFIEPDLVAGTSPEVGDVIAKGGEVTLVISTGPAQLEVPQLAGLTEEAAIAAIEENFTVSEDAPIRQFDGEVPKGQVLAALNAAGENLAAGATYSEQRPIRLVVSSGGLPSVRNLTLDAAVEALAAVNLSAVAGSEVYNDEVDKGNVIGVDSERNGEGAGRVFREGDTNVRLTMSRGPELVDVPNIVGLTWSEAKPILVDAGFQLDYNVGADLAPGLIVVRSTDPAGGTEVEKGSTVGVGFL